MKKILSLAVIVLCLLGLASCSKSDDAREILSTVPGSAQVVAVVNLEKTIKDLDLKKNGNSLEVSGELSSLIPVSGDSNPMELFSKGGIRLTSMVVFSDQNEMFATGFIGDESAFISYFEELKEGKFTNEGSAKVLGDIVIYEDRFWFCETTSDVTKVNTFMNLSEKNSMAAREIASSLADEKENITSVVSYSYLTMLSGSMVASVQQVAGDVDYIYFDIDFEKGKCEMEAKFLDGKYKPIKFDDKLFGTINLGTVKMLEGKVDYLVAINIPGTTMKGIGNQLSQIMDIPGLSGIDGTVAVGFTTTMQSSGMPTAMAVVKTASSQDATTLGETIKNMLGTAVKVSVKGQTLLARTAELNGALSIGPRFDDLKGAILGVVVSPTAVKDMFPGDNIPFDGASLVLKPDNGSVKLEAKVYTGSNANSLITLIKLFSKFN